MDWYQLAVDLRGCKLWLTVDGIVGAHPARTPHPGRSENSGILSQLTHLTILWVLYLLVHGSLTEYLRSFNPLRLFLNKLPSNSGIIVLMPQPNQRTDQYQSLAGSNLRWLRGPV